MGVGYCPTPSEIQFNAVDYSDKKTIQGLVRFHHQLKEDTFYQPNFELISILTDLSIAINHVPFTPRQKQVLKLYMDGWTEWEIGKQLGGITQQGINNHIKRICSKLSDFLTKENIAL